MRQISSWHAAFAATLLGVAVLCGACAPTEEGAGPEAASGPPFKPVADIQQLMEMVIDPAADVVWESVGTIITAEETEEIFPRNDEEWAAVRNSAMLLAESGNLLMVGDRAEEVAPGPWMIMSQALVDAGVAAFEAAESKDPDAVFAVGEQIYNACETCHVLYWYTEEDAVVR